MSLQNEVLHYLVIIIDILQIRYQQEKVKNTRRVHYFLTPQVIRILTILHGIINLMHHMNQLHFGIQYPQK